jgi:hypothetical protein
MPDICMPDICERAGLRYSPTSEEAALKADSFGCPPGAFPDTDASPTAKTASPAIPTPSKPSLTRPNWRKWPKRNRPTPIGILI